MTASAPMPSATPDAVSSEAMRAANRAAVRVGGRAFACGGGTGLRQAFDGEEGDEAVAGPAGPSRRESEPAAAKPIAGVNETELDLSTLIGRAPPDVLEDNPKHLRDVVREPRRRRARVGNSVADDV